MSGDGSGSVEDGLVPHVVRQGDMLSRLAPQRGFEPAVIWDLPANEQVRATRGDMDMLHPGDILYFPEEPAEGAPLTAGQTHHFSASPGTHRVSVVLRGEDGEALANVSYAVLGLGRELEAQTDAEGRAEIDLPLHLDDLRIRVRDPERVYRIAVGHMDPVAEPSGVAKRLANLGYMIRSGIGEDDEERAFRLHHALRMFQTARGLEASGEPDEATRTALVEAHGS